MYYVGVARGIKFTTSTWRDNDREPANLDDCRKFDTVILDVLDWLGYENPGSTGAIEKYVDDLTHERRKIFKRAKY